MRRPVNSPYTITTEFGVADSYAFFGRHSGVDYAVPLNRQVLAPAAGQVVYAAFNSTGGNMIIIHDGQFYHRLMHNNRIHVSVNQRVSEGQHIADAGTTGLSTGVHVHWDIMDNIISSAIPRPTAFSGFKDPSAWLAGAYQQASTPQGGTDVATREQVKNYYRGVLHREADEGGLNNYQNRDGNFIIADMLNSQERRNFDASVQAARDGVVERDRIINELRAQLQNASGTTKAEMQALLDQIGTLTAQYTDEQRKSDELTKALEAEKANIKKETVYTHDQETKDNVNAILKLLKSVWGSLTSLHKKKANK